MWSIRHTPADEPFILETGDGTAAGGGSGGEAPSSSVAESASATWADERRGSAAAGGALLPGRGSAVQGQQTEATKASDDYPYVVVMDCGGPSVFISIVTQRIAGYSANKVVGVFRSLSKQTALLHEGGLVHCDIKLRNALNRREDDVKRTSAVMLCDLDAALAVGAARPAGLKCSTGYLAPEAMKWQIASDNAARSGGDPPGLIAQPSLDVWSLGVVLYEVCTGR